jgi:hypothetical protein
MSASEPSIADRIGAQIAAFGQRHPDLADAARDIVAWRVERHESGAARVVLTSRADLADPGTGAVLGAIEFREDVRAGDDLAALMRAFGLPVQ